eukprot:NODE_59_length_28102_cov_0.971110.p13 type:complete len:295 gc:universal NODE_59_length_28102_cov_0.971110:17545-18429(+)
MEIISFDNCCTVIKKLLTKANTLYQYIDLANEQSNQFLHKGDILQFTYIQYSLSKIKEEVEEQLGLDFTPLDDYLDSNLQTIPDQNMDSIRKLVLKGINESIEEYRSSRELITNNLMEILGSDSTCILLIGKVDDYLKLVSDKSQLEKHSFVCVDLDMAQSLGKFGLNVTVVRESHIFALMSKFDKIIISVYALLADTSVLTMTGSLNVCHLAKYFKKPVVVTLQNHLISSKHAEQLQAVDKLKLPFEKQNIGLKSPYEFVSLENVDIFVTSQGNYPSSYAYQLVREFGKGFKI